MLVEVALGAEELSFIFLNALGITTSCTQVSSTNVRASAAASAHCLAAADAPNFQLCSLCCHLAAALAVRIHCR